MTQKEMCAQIDACIVACESLLKRMYAMKADASKTENPMTERSTNLPVFVPRHYAPIAVWLETAEGKAATPDFRLLKTWAERAVYLSRIVGWEVDDHQIRRAINRLNHPKRKKGQ